MIRRLFTVQYNYEVPIERQRANVLLLMNWALIFSWLAAFVLVFIPQISSGDPTPPSTIVAVTGIPILSYVVFQLVQGGRLQPAATMFVLLALLAAIPGIFEGLDAGSASVLFLAVVTAGVLVNRRGTVVVGGILIVMVLVEMVIEAQTIALTGESTLLVALGDLVGLYSSVAMLLLLVTVFMAAFGGGVQEMASTASSGTERLQRLVRFNVQAGRSFDERVVLNQAVTLINEQFSGVFARIFIFDDQDDTTYYLYTGFGEQQTGSIGDRFVNGNNIVGQVVQTRRRARVSIADDIKVRSHFLSSSQHGLALPLVDNQTTIGVVDVQTRDPEGFDPDTLELLQLMADQLVVPLKYIKRIDDLWQELQSERERVTVSGEQTRVQSVQSSQAISATWGVFMRGLGKGMYGYDILPNSSNPVPADDLPDTVRPALERGEVVIEERGDENVINVPIQFRGVMLGAMAFTVPASAEINERQTETALAVAQRLGLALENTRLFEQSQAQALRERTAGEVASQLFSTTDVDAMLGVAAESFREALGAVSTRVYISPAALDVQQQGEQV